VDDGSTDGTYKAINKYGSSVQYIRTDHIGTAHARNVGMRRATGEYISFLDSDDLYYPYKTTVQSSILDAFPDLAMISSDFSGFDNAGFWDEFHLRQYHCSGFRGNTLAYDDIYSHNAHLADFGLNVKEWPGATLYFGNIFSTYLQRMIVCTNTIMFRRKIVESVGFQNEEYRLLQEHHFVLRITKQFSVGFIDIPTYKLRYHTRQASDITRGHCDRNANTALVIEKQRYLLRTGLELGVEDNEYYCKNRELVDRRIVELIMALAIPLMSQATGAQEARSLLKRCGEFGKNPYFFFSATFLPWIGRRIVVKAFDVARRQSS